MKVLTVKFSKPITQAAVDAGVVWGFIIETDEKLAHGYAGIGGELRLTDDGWQARHFDSTPWQPAAKDRRTAIENAMPAIVAIVAKHKTESDEKEIKEREEWKQSQRLAAQQKILHAASAQLLASLVALLPSAHELLDDMMQDPTPLRGSGWQSLQDEIAKAQTLVDSLKEAGL